MAKTYLELVNIVLRDINEIPLSEAAFQNPRGLHAFVKEAVNRALMDVINFNDEWPWLASAVLQPGTSAASHEFTTTPGVVEYTLPTGIDQIDWDNVILTDTVNSEETRYKLDFVEYDHITDRLEDFEEDLRPRYVYETPSKLYIGVFPKPDAAYKISYIAWREPSFLVNATDTLPFEDRYYTVIVSRARYYAWLFRENAQQASIALNEYEDNLKTMYRNIVMPKSRQMRAV